MVPSEARMDTVDLLECVHKSAWRQQAWRQPADHISEAPRDAHEEDTNED